MAVAYPVGAPHPGCLHDQATWLPPKWYNEKFCISNLSTSTLGITILNSLFPSGVYAATTSCLHPLRSVIAANLPTPVATAALAACWTAAVARPWTPAATPAPAAWRPRAWRAARRPPAATGRSGVAAIHHSARWMKGNPGARPAWRQMARPPRVMGRFACQVARCNSANAFLVISELWGYFNLVLTFSDYFLLIWMLYFLSGLWPNCPVTQV